MAVTDRLRRPAGRQVPPNVEKNVDRAQEAIREGSATRRLCLRFFRNDTYFYINEKGFLSQQSTVTHVTGGGKPPHRIRNKYNFIRPIVEGKVSASTKRVPGYEIMPTTTDPEAWSAARMSRKAAFYGYDKWRIRRATTKVVTLAIVCDGGFARPYFDPDVAPFYQVEDEETGKIKTVGTGEIKIATYTGDEVGWMPGCEFDESPYWIVQQARPISEIKKIPGYLGGDLVADATTHDLPADKPTADMALLTEYLERPCIDYPNGRRLLIVNKRQIIDEEPYPCVSHDGKVLDEPVIHRLTYTVDPDADRDMGLGELLIDLQRTVQDCWNKLLEWKNRTLNPQMMAPKGSQVTRRDDTPGSITYYNVVGGDQKPEWEKPPSIPRELFDMLELARQHMRDISADADIQAEADLAARTVQAVIETNAARWQSFLGDLAEFHSRLMRHCLMLVQRHYAEPRLVHLKGRFGPESLEDFRGADLRGQAEVTVSPGSLENRSVAQITQQAMSYADRGWISPEQTMAMINGGQAEQMVDDFEFQLQRAHRLIQTIKRGPEAVFAMRANPDGTPGWMPRLFDNVAVQIHEFETWMMTAEWDELDDPMREVATLIYQGMQQLKAEQEAQALMAQTAQAEQLGAENAAKPQQAKPMPDQRMPDLPQ